MSGGLLGRPALRIQLSHRDGPPKAESRRDWPQYRKGPLSGGRCRPDARLQACGEGPRRVPPSHDRHYRAPMPDTTDDARAAARASGLRYSTDAKPGWTRHRAGRGFSYRDADGVTIRDKEARGAHRRAGDPTRMDRRVDLPVARWSPSGHRQGRSRSQAVPLSRPLARAPRRRELRAHDRLRRCPPADPATRAAGPRIARVVAREGPGRGRPAAGANPDPCRERGVRAAQPIVRADDPAGSPRRRGRPQRSLPVPGQVRRRPRGRPA